MAERQFQVHDGTFGISLYERETAEDALLDFFADRARGQVRCDVTTDGDTASVTVDGVTYTARPVAEP